MERTVFVTGFDAQIYLASLLGRQSLSGELNERLLHHTAACSTVAQVLRARELGMYYVTIHRSQST